MPGLDPLTIATWALFAQMQFLSCVSGLCTLPSMPSAAVTTFLGAHPTHAACRAQATIQDTLAREERQAYLAVAERTGLGPYLDRRTRFVCVPLPSMPEHTRSEP